MSSDTELFLPTTFPYPIRLVALAAHPDDKIHRGARLLSYSFTYTPPGASPELRFGTWDSSMEGTVKRWSFREGDIISARKAKEVAAVYVNEPCKHGVQLGGLCCLCGKDMTDYDYTGFSDASRASIQMTHLANGPTVSLEEAQRIEKETAENLLSTRKLSLIVDLDQTIVHATVDPTVGEWISEGEAWEVRQAEKAQAQRDKGNDSDDTTSDTDDEVNPNWEALKDVKKFRLGPEALGQPPRGANVKGRENTIEQEGCMYYIKPRPGWNEFLQTMATKYEMHVYTMGTRAYAEEVCAAIDPDGKIFGGRLLSRDESGSLTQKSLQRLFPCDQSMVVIIDDRADVWEWSPNLVKVIPYDFFVGIGDINSTFLPKLDSLASAIPSGPPPTPPKEPSIEDATPTQGEEADLSLSISSEEPPPISESVITSAEEPQADETSDFVKNEILERNTMALEAQFEERPLAKKQEALQEEEEKEEAAQSAQSAQIAEPQPADAATSTPPAAPAPHHHHKERKPLLKNDDYELIRVRQLLEKVHEQFYAAYDLRSPVTKTSKRKGAAPPRVPYDVRSIIPVMRADVLRGVHILFSSVIPLDTRPEVTEVWRTAHAFGARCYTELSGRITHVVATKRGTVKVDSARRQGGIKIVWLSWFTDSVALWQRQDETRYLIDPEPPVPARLASPPSDPHQISSDPEPDADDWDEERTTADGERLALDEVDWAEVNDEVDAAMNESDDDDGDGDGDGEQSEKGQSANVSEDEGSWTDESNSLISSAPPSPRISRKRLRSLTPSESGLNGNVNSDALRSRLAKRRKMVADRSGASRLKEEIIVDEIPAEQPPKLAALPVGGNVDDEEDGSDGDAEDDGAMDEDDFLARELEEEWG
ncbi:RNA polymerase II subunit A C-terminal domain phosphatase [Sparassis crispa]|uniref:RNA polymerase II subunit A C-terminal domain phosphatase n=1 Tax=Sparassis crispa TaxID=139825 RepID=A0A401G5W3_9APHY|nr:RNA polymerase II subunit A C-terminal domain phosphatase [Sparassis crispa]GBE77556.1 RNA polymerase II subunit A C-terminal domain phosphatase [Sparassis crispa]